MYTMLCLLDTSCLNFACDIVARYSSNSIVSVSYRGLVSVWKSSTSYDGGHEPRFFALLQLETLDSLILRLSE